MKKALVISVVCGIMITASGGNNPFAKWGSTNVTGTTASNTVSPYSQALSVKLTGSDWQAGHNSLSWLLISNRKQ